MGEESLVFVHFQFKRGSKIRFCFDKQALGGSVENLVMLYNKLISSQQ
jgi:hypothetical protein